MDRIERFRGCLLGLAAGDALGTTLEFKSPGSFEPIRDMVGGGPFDLKPGEWTDDTSMALCLAESLIEKKGFDPEDQMERYVRWWRDGYMSSTGECFDIGGATQTALARFVRTGEAYAGSTDQFSAGNGSLMRLAPVPMYFANDAKAAIERCGDSSRTTHATFSCIDACRYFGGMIVGALNGVAKEELLIERYAPVKGYWGQQQLNPEIDEVACGSFKRRRPPEIAGKGHVVKSLEAALWAFYSTNDFESGCLAAANLGDDADTTAAVYGQIAGAFYGESSIPKKWRERIAMGEKIGGMAEKLMRS